MVRVGSVFFDLKFEIIILRRKFESRECTVVCVVEEEEGCVERGGGGVVCMDV